MSPPAEPGAYLTELVLPKLPQRLPRTLLSVADIEAILHEAEPSTVAGLRDRAMLELLYATGLRRMELAGLARYDVDVMRRLVFVREGKGRKDRVVPLGERAAAWLDKYLIEARPQLLSVDSRLPHNPTMKRSLQDWLDYQLHTHPQAIAMGLERVREVADRLRLGRPGKHVAIVGGTNGKGSTVAFIEAIARAAGLRVGAFTSPHLLRYNERVQIDGIDVEDRSLIDAFERIEAARAEIPLTYFEFSALAALLIFEQSDLDLAILEVGLGGRLDAVNIVDADVAVITTVDLDHQGYLGADRESIGFEKAGILRAGKPCVLGERDPPSSVLRYAYAIGAVAIRGHCDYLIDRFERGWHWREPDFEIELPMPALAAPAQLDNAAAAIAALRALPLDIPESAFRKGVASAQVSGRLQRIDEAPELIVDVAHNPQAAGQLAAWLAGDRRRTYAVFSALADKDIEGIVAVADPAIEHWFLAGIDVNQPRALTGEALTARLTDLIEPQRRTTLSSVAQALEHARAKARPEDRIMAFGSFHTVTEVLKAGLAGGARL